MRIEPWLKLLLLPFILLLIGAGALADWLRFHLVYTDRGKCPQCGGELVKSGYATDGFIQHYKCPTCSREGS